MCPGINTLLQRIFTCLPTPRTINFRSINQVLRASLRKEWELAQAEQEEAMQNVRIRYHAANQLEGNSHLLHYVPGARLR